MNLSNLINTIQQTFFMIKPKKVEQFCPIHQTISEGFSPQEFTEFYALSVKESFMQGQDVFHEHDAPDSFHIILEGEAEVYVSRENELNEMQDHVIATLKKNDVIGDMALVENKPRSASVRAKTLLTVLTFKMDEVKLKPDIFNRLIQNMARILSERLRFTNQVTVKKMQESLAQAQARNVLGVFMVAIFWLISLYTLSLTSLISLEKHLSNSTFLSIGLIFFFASGIILAMRLTGLPLSRFGISFDNVFQKSMQAIFYTLPMMCLFLMIKVYFVYCTEQGQTLHVFSGFDEGISDGQFSLSLYLTVIFLYALLCPVQELVTRSALQSTFFYFLPGSLFFREWNAIILSNLIFSSAHSHLSLGFASLTFLPGLFWGVLFQKQRSFIAVSISHIVLGVWVVFIIGAKGLIYG